MDYFEETALNLFLSNYVKNYAGDDVTFEEICKDIEEEEYIFCDIWEPLEEISGANISTLIHEVKFALEDAYQRGIKNVNPGKEKESTDNNQ